MLTETKKEAAVAFTALLVQRTVNDLAARFFLKRSADGSFCEMRESYWVSNLRRFEHTLKRWMSEIPFRFQYLRGGQEPLLQHDGMPWLLDLDSTKIYCSRCCKHFDCWRRVEEGRRRTRRLGQGQPKSICQRT